MHTEHIGVVTGLSDLLNFFAALRKKLGLGPSAPANVTAVLFGSEMSLPQALVEEFDAVLSRAFPAVRGVKIPTACVRGNAFIAKELAGAELPREAGRQRVVYGNAVHKRFHQQFYAYLKPDAFVFFDNGLSSYAAHDADIEDAFAALSIPFPSLACYSLNPPLDVPPYLAKIPEVSLRYDDYDEAFSAMRHRDLGWNGYWSARHVIIGTSLFRGKKISWDEERAIYMRLIERLKITRPGEGILYKAHPRASNRPLIAAEDGVEVIDSTFPAEPFVQPGSKGTVYSITSTALFTFPRLFLWEARRIETPASRKLLDESPHLSLVDLIPPTPIDAL